MDDRAHIVGETLQRVRRKLLDVTRRNTLLNFRETRRTIRVIDELPDETFHRLVVDGTPMKLLPFDPPEELDQTTSINIDPTIGIQPGLFKGSAPNTKQTSTTNIPDTPRAPSYELPIVTDQPKPRHCDDCLQTPLIDQPLERRCKNMLRHWRTGIEETGMNFLYLAIGFLEWYEDDNSDISNKAPLILVPIQIERARLNSRTNCYSYVLNYSGEDIETNLSLAEKLDHDFDLILPEITDEATPEEYFVQVAETVSNRRRWRPLREMVIGFFSFAKLRLYRDLDDASWPDNSQLTSHPIIQRILAGTDRAQSDAFVYGEEYDTDEHPDADSIPLILDADSSQHSAIMDTVLNDKSLVIEGPPGTGKSQTITNLVAGALHEGKTVLFVSEKKAALEVVRNRLDGAELGDFCLELHSHKTQKGKLHQDLTKRLTQHYRDTRELDHEINDFRRERQRLRNYYGLLDSAASKTDETIFKIFWGAERWQEEIQGEPVRFVVDDALQLTRSQITATISRLEDFVRIRSQLPLDVIDTWHGFEPDLLLPGDEQDIRDELSNIRTGTIDFANFVADQTVITSELMGQTIADLRLFTRINTVVLAGKPKQQWDEKLALSFLESRVVTTLEDLRVKIAKWNELRKQAAEVLGASDKLSEEDLKRIEQASSKLESLGYSDVAPKQLRNLRDLTSSTVNTIEDLKREAETINDIFSEPLTRMEDIVGLSTLNDFLETAPPEIVIQAHSDHALKVAQVLQERASSEFRELTELLTNQSSFFYLNKLPESSEIRRLADTVRKCNSWLKRLFSKQYRQVKKALLEILADRKLIKAPDLAERLYKLTEILGRIQPFEKNSDYQKVFGNLFKGMETDWQRLDQLVGWSQKLSKTLGSENSAKRFLTDFSMNRERIGRVSNRMASRIRSLTENVKRVRLRMKESDRLGTIRQDLQRRLSSLEDLSRQFEDYSEFGHINIVSLRNAVQNALASRVLRDEIEGDDRYSKDLGKAFLGLNTDIETLKRISTWIGQIKEQGHLKPELMSWLISHDTDMRISIVKSVVDASRKYFDSLDSFVKRLSQSGNFSFSEWLGVRIDDAKLDDLVGRLDICIGASGYLIAWADYCRTRRQALEVGLSPIISGIEEGATPGKDAVAHFRHAVYRSMAKEIMQKHSELATFQRATYDNIREKISELDQKIQLLSRQRIAHRVSLRRIPAGVGTGYIRDYTELSLIARELSKQKRHIPIRQLVHRAGNALQALKPCFMMGPLSVAQYLIPGAISFDLVIMDEASQLRLEDALGAIARAKQVVVVGDPKQLPPTDFFKRIDEYDIEEDDRTAAEEAESILDICQTCLDSRRLRWHYRSEHESLVAFSNNQFYDDNLIVFPSPHVKNGEYGVHHHYVEGATYKKGRNRKEAVTVAHAVMDHFQRWPEVSLGVATFNIEQRDLIFDELERLQKETWWLEQRIRATEETQEPFFIKNLENVQGDERDVIFISTTYGPDRDSGQVYQRFGPINRPTGWRRLNVIVTRAKKRLRLFTSMRSTDIKIPPSVSRGVSALRSYLEYAENGAIQDPGKTTGREPDSDFEIAVAKPLNQRGYRTAYQVGVAGFYVDIGVRHPDRDGEFILGIECDGASYHSAKSIRDRDLLRQRILKSKGWRIHRIWSTDWFKNKEREFNSLLDILENLISKDRVKARRKKASDSTIRGSVKPDFSSASQDYDAGTWEPEEEKPAEESFEDVQEDLRKVLFDYRKKKIEPNCEDLNESILSDEMLAYFVRKMPTTHREFLQFPYTLRKKVARGQGKYLDEIFEIMEEFEI